VIGHNDDDNINGGAGNDYVEGGKGNDRCLAEVAHFCES